MTTFAERRRADLRKRSRRRTLLLAAAAVPPVLAAGTVFSPVLDVDRITVTGNRRAHTDVVENAARVKRGDAMVTLDLDGIRDRVARLPQVRSATVTREWPGTLRIVVVERTPAIAVRRPGRYDLVDIDGVLIGVVRNVPPGTPILSHPGEPDRAVVNATVDLMRVLPPDVRRQVRDLSADLSGTLSFTLADGAVVVWGTGERADEKVRALALLLPQHAKRYDLRVPDRPAVVPSASP
ncbi:MAG TPA: FtsQ-type POTRA domain-containing protein [Mycobacteriales bacterium]